MQGRRIAFEISLLLGLGWAGGDARGQPGGLAPVEDSTPPQLESPGTPGKVAPKSAETAETSATWSTTEVQFQYAKLDAPSFAGGNSSWTKILTFQHSSGWKFGDNFVFVDVMDDTISDGFSDQDVYLEWYSNFSLGKILHRPISWGPISDVGLIMGINLGADAQFVKWTPGLRLSWKLPGFAFLNTDFAAYLDDSGGLAGGGAPAQSDSFMMDISWALPFSIYDHDFSIEGHAEFIGRRRDELGGDVAPWVLAQPQFRYDLGKTLFRSPKKLFVGVEWQIWPNKVGDSFTDENALQALAVWRL